MLSIATSILMMLSLVFGGSNVTEPPTFNDSHIEQLAEQLKDYNEVAHSEFIDDLTSVEDVTDTYINEHEPIYSGVFEVAEDHSTEFISRQDDQMDYTSDIKYNKGVYVLSFKNDDCISVIKIK